jgi:hypothetical protein
VATGAIPTRHRHIKLAQDKNPTVSPGATRVTSSPSSRGHFTASLERTGSAPAFATPAGQRHDGGMHDMDDGDEACNRISRQPDQRRPLDDAHRYRDVLRAQPCARRRTIAL